jgi:hypothetical protein
MLLKGRATGREEDEIYVISCWMALGKREETGI